MPPVEFDTIPRFASSSIQDVKTSLSTSNVLELGSVMTRSRGASPQDSGLIKDVEVPQVDSEDETTVDKLMKDYSEEESDEDSDYVPSEDSEAEFDSTSNDFINTRSKGIAPQYLGMFADLEIPEVDSEDETTIDKIMKDYSDEEDASADDSDYVPSENSEDELEFDSEASMSDDEFEHEDIEDVMIPEEASFSRRAVVIEDVKIPNVSNAILKDVPVKMSLSETLVNNLVDHVAGYSLVQAGIQTLDFGMDICEKMIAPTPYKEHVQGVRRHLRSVRRSGGDGQTKDGIVAYGIQKFKVNWFLSFAGMTVETDSIKEKKSTGRSSTEQDYCDDDETTVYKLMQEYDSQDDEDYVPNYSSEDSMEFYSDCSDDETIMDKLVKDYSDNLFSTLLEAEDSDYTPCDDSEDEDSLEYDSEAEDSDSDYDSEDDEECSEDETTVDKLMKNYSDEESDFDADYVPGEEIEDDIETVKHMGALIEFDSDASVTESEDSEYDEESEDESCSEIECEDSETLDESASQDNEESSSQDDEESSSQEDDEASSQDDEE